MQKKIIFFIAVSLLAISCDSGPKVIRSETTKSSVSAHIAPNSIPAFNEVLPPEEAVSNVHEVLVEEVLNTEKYAYLKVSEDDKKFWIAISKREIAVGDSYQYRGGLLKRNFFSREFNRVFDTVYLVSNIWKKEKKEALNATPDQSMSNVDHGHPLPNLKVEKIEATEGTIKLADLFANKTQYANQTIKVTGKVVKVNPMIMNRNWLHLQDGSGEGLDLTVTTMEKVQLGAVVSLEGTIALDKDFGSGYRYDIIMEHALLK